MKNVSEICIFSHTNLANVCTFPTPQKQSINRLLCYLHLFLILDDAYRQRTQNQQNTCHNHHIALMRTHQTQDSSTADGSHNLRDTDGSVKQTEISTHVTISLQSIGNKGERHRQHGCPTGTNHQERNKLQILVMQERYQGKAHTTDSMTWVLVFTPFSAVLSVGVP